MTPSHARPPAERGVNVLERIHEGYVYERRIRLLCRHLAGLFPPNVRVLDVGCGDGALARLLTQDRPDLEVEGIDTVIRVRPRLRVTVFDGARIPYRDRSVDFVMFVDTLHHTEDSMALLREAVRVAGRGIVIKDHTRDGFLAGPTLRFMDWVGNARHGVALPYRYWTKREWEEAFDRLGVAVDSWKSDLHLYPAPASWLFDRSLHFLTKLRRK